MKLLKTLTVIMIALFSFSFVSCEKETSKPQKENNFKERKIKDSTNEEKSDTISKTIKFSTLNTFGSNPSRQFGVFLNENKDSLSKTHNEDTIKSNKHVVRNNIYSTDTSEYIKNYEDTAEINLTYINKKDIYGITKPIGSPQTSHFFCISLNGNEITLKEYESEDFENFEDKESIQLKDKNEILLFKKTEE